MKNPVSYLMNISKTRPVFVLLAIIILGAGLRFYGLGDKSLWSDEIGSILTSQKKLDSLFRYVVEIDAHPPLYYLGLHFWLKLFGKTESAVRALSALIGCCSIVIAFLIGKQLKDTHSGLILSFLFAISSYQAYFSQEARLYSLVMFLFGAGYYFYAKFLNKRRKTELYKTALLNLMGAYTFLYYLIVVAIQDLFLLIMMLLDRRKDDLKHFFLSRLFFAVLYTPWLWVIHKKIKQVSTMPSQTDALRGWAIPNACLEYFAGISRPENIPAYFLLLGVILFIVGISLIMIRRDNKIWFNFMVFVGPILGVILVPIKVHVFESKHLIFISLPLLIFLSSYLSRDAWKYTKPFILGVFIFVNLCSFMVYFDKLFEKERWKQTVGIITENEKKGELVLFNPGYAGYPFDYYYRGDMVRYGLSSESPLHEIRQAIDVSPGVWLVELRGRSLQPNKQISDFIFNSYKFGLYQNLTGYSGNIKIYYFNNTSTLHFPEITRDASSAKLLVYPPPTK